MFKPTGTGINGYADFIFLVTRYRVVTMWTPDTRTSRHVTEIRKTEGNKV